MELEILILTAEIAVALAGFSAIVSNFSRDWTVGKKLAVGEPLDSQRHCLIRVYGSVDHVTASECRLIVSRDPMVHK